MNLKFTKMHGLGNDFMVIDGINQSFNLDNQTLCNLANRYTGIGFDQCLIIEKSDHPDIDFYYRIFNADGGEVGQCGNGARCLARFTQYYGLTHKASIKVKTQSTLLELTINADQTVTVNMGIPNLIPEIIPMTAPSIQKYYSLELDFKHRVQIHALSIGNPHAVILVDDVSVAPVDTIGKQVSEHFLFPNQANTGFMQILSPSHIALRVYERGCGETKSCGSGAVAAAVIAQMYYQLQNKIRVSLPGGDLWIDWPDTEGPIYLTGPATFVYEGTLI